MALFDRGIFDSGIFDAASAHELGSLSLATSGRAGVAGELAYEGVAVVHPLGATMLGLSGSAGVAGSLHSEPLESPYMWDPMTGAMTPRNLALKKQNRRKLVDEDMEVVCVVQAILASGVLDGKVQRRRIEVR